MESALFFKVYSQKNRFRQEGKNGVLLDVDCKLAHFKSALKYKVTKDYLIRKMNQMIFIDVVKKDFELRPE